MNQNQLESRQRSPWRTLEADLRWWWGGTTEASLKQRPFMWILRFRSTVFRSGLIDSLLLLLFFIALLLTLNELNRFELGTKDEEKMEQA